MLLKKKAPPPTEIAGVKVRVSNKARRLALRVDVRAGDVVLTWPRAASERAALAFIEQHKCWIHARRQKMPKPRSLMDEKKVLIHGKAYDIVPMTGRGVTCLKDGKLLVYGRPEYLSRRIRSFLKHLAEEILTEAASQKLSLIHLKPAPIRVIDPKTRWGSCSPDGRMMFSWRLILTPPEVLDYVVAHEVAHRVHMNHSKKFWELCHSMSHDAKTARQWLKTHGNAVMMME